MKFIIAKSAGFCFGVKNAVETVEKNIGKYSRLYTLGEIIHNPQVVSDLKQRGVMPIENASEIDEGAVIIRSHGAPQQKINEFATKNIEIIDATCPFVRRIQKIAQSALQKNEFIAIIGEKEHPEVIGINGHCDNSAHIVNSITDVYALPQTEKDICIVSQTTARKDFVKELVAAISEKYKNNKISVFDTVCDATSERQNEAMKIAEIADVTIVIGGRQSSNTQKLYKICSEKCLRTYAVETVEEVSAIQIYNNDIIGVTAGASTPDRLIKEVVDRMSENEVREENLSFEEEFEKTLVKIHPGQVLTGKVIYVKDNEVSVDIGYKADGLITKEELTASGEEDPKTLFNPGDEITVEVVKVKDDNGNVILSRKKVVAREQADKAIAGLDNGTIFEVTVGEAVKGGLTADYNGIRVFIPRSQVKANGFAKDLDRYVGQTLRVRAIEIDAAKRKIVATHGAIIAEEKAAAKEAAWAKLEVGAEVTGVVKRLADFGAFVDIGGVEGLVHISDIAWYHINKPADVFAVGQEIKVVILKLDAEKEHIALGYKQLQPMPWDNAEEKYPINTVVKGTVVRTAAFGAFVALEPGIDALLHISQISNGFVTNVNEAVKIGQEIEALITEVDSAKKRISLSVRALLPEENNEAEEANEANEAEATEATDAE